VGEIVGAELGPHGLLGARLDGLNDCDARHDEEQEGLGMILPTGGTTAILALLLR
jgi:hypothetical protein